MTKQYNLNQSSMMMYISTFLFFGVMLLMFLKSEDYKFNDLSFVASNSMKDKLYFDIKLEIEYDLISTSTDDNLLLLRYRHPFLYQGLINSNYTLLNNFELVKLSGNPSNLNLSINGTKLIMNINGDELFMTFNEDLTYNSFQKEPTKLLYLSNGFIIDKFLYNPINDDDEVSQYEKIKLIPLDLNRNFNATINIKDKCCLFKWYGSCEKKC